MPFITQGKTNLKYILIVVILAAIVGGGILGYQYWWIAKFKKTEGNVTEIKLPGKAEDEAIEKFDPTKIGALFTFYDSEGTTKKILLYDSTIYLTNENLSQDSALKIIDLDLRGISNIPHVSFGSDKKYIVIELGGEPMSDMVIIDENGNIITSSVYTENPQLIEEIKKMEIGWGQHGISFQEWVDSKTFIMNVFLANGSLYKVNVDVTTGKTIGKPQKIE
jgi:hypothetical protein